MEFSDDDLLRAYRKVAPKRDYSFTEDDLLQKLSLAFDKLDKKNPRRAHIRALLAVVRYLVAKDATRYAEHFTQLAVALDDLNSGVVAPLLRPAHVENRPADSTNIWWKRAWVALAIESLIARGATRRQAAAITVRYVKNICDLVGTTVAKPDKVALSWRDELLKGRGRVKNSYAAADFERGRQQIKEVADDYAALVVLFLHWCKQADDSP